MPFGGHQQSLDSKILDKLPPIFTFCPTLCRGMMKMAGESEGRIGDVMEVKETRISINNFERISKAAGFKMLKRDFFLINPSYKYKFGATPRKQYGWLAAIPWVRDFFTATCYLPAEIRIPPPGANL